MTACGEPAGSYHAAIGESEALSDLHGAFGDVQYRRPLRRYQLLALDAFERARGAGQRHVYLVMPPGAGKTVLGLEIARRLGRRTLVLSPNTAIQAQWIREWRDFQPVLFDATTDPSLPTPITSLCYQALCNLESHAAQLDDAALVAWHAGRAPEIEADAEPLSARDEADLAHLRRRARAAVARDGDHRELLGLLHANGRELVDRVSRSGPWTIVLDECHHLLQMWGWLVRALVAELGEQVTLLGLTATPPGDMDQREAALHGELFGRADFEVPTPAAVKEGSLAPYQELVYLTTPLDQEARYIADEQVRFQELVARLEDPDFGSLPFWDWLRLRVFERSARPGVTVSWARFEREEPALAQAALRYCFAIDLAPPPGARLREVHRRAPAAADWVAMIDDYCMHRLRGSVDPPDVEVWDAIRAGLQGIGYRLTRQGVRAATTTVDRVLMLSAGKAAAALDILGAEHRALGSDLRALLLCDFERAGVEAAPLARGVLDPQAGSAALLLQLVAGDSTGVLLRPVLLTGRTVACDPATALDLFDWLTAQAPEIAARLRPPSGPAGGREGVVVVRPENGGWEPRHYVPLVTRYFEEGRCQCLVGTRGLLGEGWDARSVNVLIDLTAVTTRVSVHQMRGRSLRLDPEQPRKVAHNWDVVCVAPGHVKGAADYDRFVRKHTGYYALAENGEIESGVSHVDPGLSPYGPPPVDSFATLNARMLARADERAEAYARWRIAQPYQNVLTDTVRVRFGRSAGPPVRRPLRPLSGASPPRPWRPLLAAGAVAAAALAAGVPAGLGVEAGAAGLAAVMGGAWWTGRAVRAHLVDVGPAAMLEDLGAALAEALSATGLVRPALGLATVRVSPLPDGTYRCFLEGASLQESRTFADALDELLAPIDQPRYVIPRYVAAPPASAWSALWRVLRPRWSRAGLQVVYHAVPSVLAANRDLASAFGRAWNVHVSDGEPLYQRDPRAAAVIELQRGEDPFAITTQMRTLWR
ncbi:MAG TPA: DEAD/DEAH box helicase family protein [Candidatus Dormibacteraeota bacterium]